MLKSSFIHMEYYEDKYYYNAFEKYSSYLWKHSREKKDKHLENESQQL